jgi:hypothetical protein
MMPRSVVFAGLVASAAAPSLSAQAMRNFTASRAVAGEKLVRASLDFHGGNVTVSPATSDELFHVLMRYDAERFVPVQDYEPRTGILHLGLRPVGATGVRVTSRAQLAQSAEFSFARDVPLMLSANFGAAEATLDLGGLTLNELDVHASATRGQVDFDVPNRGTCRLASFSITAGQLEVRRLANAGCYQVRVEGAAGNAILGFDGVWRRDVTLVVDMSMGGLTLRLPRGTGVRLTTSRFLTTLNTEGLLKQEDGWISAGFAQAPHKLNVELKTSVGRVNLEWIPR